MTHIPYVRLLYNRLGFRSVRVNAGLIVDSVLPDWVLGFRHGRGYRYCFESCATRP